MTYNPDSEDALEQETMALFAGLGWRPVNAYYEVFDPEATTATQPYLGREYRGEVLLPRLVSGELDVAGLEVEVGGLGG